MTNGKNLARHVKSTAPHETRRTQATVHLCSFEDCGVQCRVIALEYLEFCFKLAFSDARRKVDYTSTAQTGTEDCWESHNEKTSSDKLITTTMNGKNETWLFGIGF